jgi:lipopolysaccharide transport system ATP-binding protein
MQDVGQQGRTVFFVSHNMPAIARLCERTLLLDEGQVLQDGPPHQVVGAYLTSGGNTAAVREWPDSGTAPRGEVARLCAVRARARAIDGQIIESVDIRRPISIEMEYEVLTSGCVLMPNFHIYNDEGVHIFSAHDVDVSWRGRPRPAGRWVSTAWIPGNFLSEGTVFVSAGLTTLDPNVGQFLERDVIAFQVIDSLDGDSARGDWRKRMAGVVRPLLKWSTRFRPNVEESGHQ